MFYSEYGRFICLALLLIDAALNLFYHKHGNITKALLLPLIAAYYLTSVINPDPVLIVALAASWLGDVLLMKPSNAWFTAGGISFMLSHFLFIAVYVLRINFSLVRWAFVIPAVLIYYGVSAVIIYLLKPTTPKAMVVPMYVYLLANSTMNVFALMLFMSNLNIGGAAAYIGALLFFISDCTLFIVRFYKNGKFKSYFLCMLTYIFGELFITQGIILLG